MHENNLTYINKTIRLSLIFKIEFKTIYLIDTNISYAKKYNKHQL